MIRIHKEGIKSVLSCLVILIFFALLIFGIMGFNIASIILCSLLLILFLFVSYFFRDPDREIANSDPLDVLASADGKVVIIKEVEENEFLKSKALQVSVFMSVFNVHINYYPIGGEIVYYNYHPGNYMVAWHPKSSHENERTSIAINVNKSTILVRQIAGYIARRIVCYSEKGAKVTKGKQLGFIKFGSRLDIFLPIDSEILVKKGDKVKACQTILARLPK